MVDLHRLKFIQIASMLLGSGRGGYLSTMFSRLAAPECQGAVLETIPPLVCDYAPAQFGAIANLVNTSRMPDFNRGQTFRVEHMSGLRWPRSSRDRWRTFKEARNANADLVESLGRTGSEVLRACRVTGID